MKPTTLKQRVYSYCESHWNNGKKSIANHFIAEKHSKRTIYHYIQCWEKRLPLERKKGSGRIAKIMTPKNIKQLVKMVDNRSGVSTRQLGRKFKCDQSHIVKTLKNKAGIKYRKKITVPLRTEKQKGVIRPRCGRILKKFPDHEFIIDDESYFTLSHSDKNSNAGLYTRDIESAPDNVKFKTKQKFEKKLLVWLAISQRGISSCFIVPSGMAVNQDIYLNDCIKKRLLPFIEEYHPDGRYLFWPDLASSHYAKKVTDFLKEKNINFVEKEDNPPCVPELRPIENFWSILKGLVYANNWRAENLDQLKNRIKYCLKKVDKSVIHDMMCSVPSKLDRVRRKGLAALNPL